MTDKTETVADILAMMRESHWPLCGEWADRIERALLAQQPTHWANPETGEAISDERKRALIADYGTGGAKQAASFSRPLYATPQPEPKPAAVEYDRALIADMLHDYAKLSPHERAYSDQPIAEQVRLLEAADNADAAGVRTARREAVPMEVTEEMVERAAAEVYAAMRFCRESGSPEWVQKGNSDAQEVARRTARVILTDALQEVKTND